MDGTGGFLVYKNVCFHVRAYGSPHGFAHTLFSLFCIFFFIVVFFFFSFLTDPGAYSHHVSRTRNFFFFPCINRFPNTFLFDFLSRVAHMNKEPATEELAERDRVFPH